MHAMRDSSKKGKKRMSLQRSSGGGVNECLSVEGGSKPLALFGGVKFRPGAFLAAQLEGQPVDVNDALFIVVHAPVHPDAGWMETPTGVKVVQGVFVF